MSAEWKVDPDNRRRLLKLQKLGGNKKCVDCSAPNPQWASPKFGIFLCLECAGIHRGLGVHISFVRSITMDQFKPEELERMEKGGNEPFTEYLTSHGVDIKLPPKSKYDNPIAADYKEKLTSVVEGTEWVEPDRSGFDASKLGEGSDASTTSVSNSTSQPGRSQGATPLGSRRGTPQLADNQREKNEAYFAELGRKNMTKSDALPPSQGGKYQGFGNTPANPQQPGNGAANPSGTLSLENFQKDPMGTFSKGWNLFSSAISKNLEDVNEGVIKPGMQQMQSRDYSEEARRAATQFGQRFQETSNYGYRAWSNFTKGLQEQYDQGSQSAGADSKYSKLFDGFDAPTPEHAASEPTLNNKPHNESKDDEWEQF
ncbi:LAMI_0F14180g1_1 [Lachancea mirantina]|uniref:LAMI_0F14180g1_1 n=1 Tax=Lachancea mirantina TaxID=1230905 RepID=A0A1G4K416_9SACH|nr:LAMI_0F14180g1_1 [Lachancea mirantina]